MFAAVSRPEPGFAELARGMVADVYLVHCCAVSASLPLLLFLVHGLLVPAADPRVLAQAFELLASDGEMRHRLGCAAARRTAD